MVGAAPPQAPASSVDWLREHGYSVLMGVFFLFFLAYLIFLQSRPDVGDNGTLRSISDIFVLVGSATCAVACWYTAIRLRRMQSRAGILAGRAWIAWTCLGGAAFTYSIGQAISIDGNHSPGCQRCIRGTSENPDYTGRDENRFLWGHDRRW